LPDLIVGGYKVKSHSLGIAKDDEIFRSHKYSNDMAKTIATSCSMFIYAKDSLMRSGV
jgi:hypothetical protein